MKNLYVGLVLAALLIGTAGDRQPKPATSTRSPAASHAILDARIGPVRFALTLNG
jgi:hypothetical protein